MKSSDKNIRRFTTPPRQIPNTESETRVRHNRELFFYSLSIHLLKVVARCKLFFHRLLPSVDVKDKKIPVERPQPYKALMDSYPACVCARARSTHILARVCVLRLYDII